MRSEGTREMKPTIDQRDWEVNSLAYKAKKEKTIDKQLEGSGIAKLAWTLGTARKAGEEFIADAKERQKTETMSKEDFDTLLNNIKTKYGSNVPHHEISNVEGSVFGKTMDGNEIVQSPRMKDVTLHEYGHAQDPEVMKNFHRHKGLTEIGSSTTLYGGIAAPLAASEHNKENDNKISPFAAGATMAGLGTAAVAGGVHFRDKNEDNANRFVKRYMTDELGDAGKAQEWFDKSVLPKARNTYRQTGRAQTLMAGGLGLGIAGLSAGAINALDKRNVKMDKEASF